MRLFYAVFPPPEIQEALSQPQQAVKSFKGWKVAKPSQMHITLFFLGEQPHNRLRFLVELGQQIRVAPFSVQLGGTGYFPPTGSPRVWFVKASAEGLGHIFTQLQAALPDITVKGKFTPHLTLARKKGPAPRVGPVVFDQSFAVNQFCLVESTLEKSGSQYRILERFDLT
jgi:RNA 2',3'-cyclic 3'-phosphodiesterase